MIAQALDVGLRLHPQRGLLGLLRDQSLRRARPGRKRGLRLSHVTHEAAREAGVGAELIASVTERCYNYLEAAPQRVTGHDIPYPPAKLEKHHIPDLDRILDAVDRVMDRPNSLTGVEL